MEVKKNTLQHLFLRRSLQPRPRDAVALRPPWVNFISPFPGGDGFRIDRAYDTF